MGGDLDTPARPWAVTDDEHRRAVNTVLKLGEFSDPADTYTVLDILQLVDTARDMQAEHHARRTA